MLSPAQSFALDIRGLVKRFERPAVDGAEAVQYLVRVKELVEDPNALLLEG